MDYILGLLGITLLCALWMAFQLWLKRVDPQRDDFKPGCGACQSGSCGGGADTREITIKIDNSDPPQRAGAGDNLFGESKCAEKRSPSSAADRSAAS